jgi:TonB family protein
MLVKGLLRAFVASCVVWATTPSSYAGQTDPGLRQLTGRFVEASPGPLERLATLASAEHPIPRCLFSVTPDYPPEAASVGIRAVIRLRIVVGEFGRVVETRVADAPVLGTIDPGMPETGEPSVVDTAIRALVAVASQAVRRSVYEPPLAGATAFDVNFDFNPDKEARITPSAPASPIPQDAPPLLSAELLSGPAPSWAEGVPRVGGNVLGPTKIRNVLPTLPPGVLSAHQQAVIVIDARIEADGHVRNARVLKSVPQLDQVALDAVTQWEFSPPMVGGVPAPVLMTITIQFVGQ